MKRLLYFECFEDCGRAIAREKQIKSYARVKKLALIDSLNPEWHDLAEDWFASLKWADSSLRSE